MNESCHGSTCLENACHWWMSRVTHEWVMVMIHMRCEQDYEQDRCWLRTTAAHSNTLQQTHSMRMTVYLKSAWWIVTNCPTLSRVMDTVWRKEGIRNQNQRGKLPKTWKIWSWGQQTALYFSILHHWKIGMSKSISDCSASTNMNLKFYPRHWNDNGLPLVDPLSVRVCRQNFCRTVTAHELIHGDKKKNLQKRLCHLGHPITSTFTLATCDSSFESQALLAHLQVYLASCCQSFSHVARVSFPISTVVLY